MSRRYYQILGVRADSSVAEIKEAWLFSIKAFHPDKFASSSDKQRAIAEDRTKAINEAYDILSDPRRRALYDRELAQTSSSAPNSERGNSYQESDSRPAKNSPPRQATPSPKTSFRKNFKPGYAAFDKLPKGVREKLVQRIKGRIPVQFRVQVGGIIWASLILGAFSAFELTLLAAAIQKQWNVDERNAALMWGFVCSLASAAAAYKIHLWLRSPFKRFALVTPLYLVKTNYDELWYWPIWAITGLRGTHLHYNSIYYGTGVNVEIGTESLYFRMRNKTDYVAFSAALNAFRGKAAQADFQSDSQYFRNEDDFCDLTLPTLRRSRRWSSGLVFLLTLAAGGGLLGVATILNQMAPQTPVVALGTGSPQTYSPSQRAPILDLGIVPTPHTQSSFDPGRAVPLARHPMATPIPTPPYRRSDDPSNGFVFKDHLFRGGFGTLKITNGTTYHSVVKLVDLTTNKSVFTVFVAAGDDFTIKKIPDDTYRLAFALGRRWDWISDGFREADGISMFESSLEFQTRSVDEGNQVMHYFNTFEVTLNPVIEGNARTEQIPDGAFANY